MSRQRLVKHDYRRLVVSPGKKGDVATAKNIKRILGETVVSPGKKGDVATLLSALIAQMTGCKPREKRGCRDKNE